MTFFIFLFLLCSVNSNGVEEGDNCTKEGVAGVCTNIGQCPAALQDVKNRKEPQICNFMGLYPIVCCVLPVTTTASSTAITTAITTAISTTVTTTTESSRPNGKCILPPYPKHGTYNTNLLNSKPGDAYDIIAINVTCRFGFIVSGSQSVLCQDGWWTEPIPNCVPSCRLKPHPSVEYNCIITDGTVNNTRVCEEFEPIGTAVSPRCRARHYTPAPLDLMHCVNGLWDYVAECIPDSCRVEPHPGIEYNCITYIGNVNHSRACEEYEPIFTIIRPRCQSPRYFSSNPLGLMQCINGSWRNFPECKQECGTVIEEDLLSVAGTSARRGQVPWHAGIYDKTETPYKHICGGSLIRTSVIITAAHCFRGSLQGSLWESFAVAVGKLYREWDHPGDAEYVQHSDVDKIRLPESYNDSQPNIQDDIAVVLTYSFKLNAHVWPVCVNFNPSFEKEQVQHGSKGKIPGWGLTSENGKPTQMLKVFEMPYVSPEKCISESTADIREYITSDMFCAAGDNNVSVPLCKGDAGGGLVFSVKQEITRHYLRGVLSTVPNDSTNLCDTKSYKRFIQVTKHDRFIQEFLGYA